MIFIKTGKLIIDEERRKREEKAQTKRKIQAIELQKIYL